MSLESRKECHERARALVRAGMLDEAIGLYRDLQAQDWRDLRALAALRNLFTKLERRADLAEQLSILARYRMECGRLEEAVAEMEKAVELDRRRPGLHLKLALVLLRAGQPERARFAFYEAAYRSLRAGARRCRGRRRPGLHLKLALVLLRAGQPERARFAFYEAAYRSLRAGRDNDARRILLRSLEECGDPQAAVKRLLDSEKDAQTPQSELECRYLYRCLGWPADSAYLGGSTRMLGTVH